MSEFIRKSRPKIEILGGRVIGDDLPLFDHNAIIYTYLVDDVIVRGLHWSGKYNGPVKQLAAHLIELIKKFDIHYVTTTESQQENVMVYLRAAFLNKGLTFGFQRAGEYALLFDKAVFEPMPKLPAKVVTITKNPKVDDWQQMKVAYFNLRHKKLRRRWRIADVHGPSSIEWGNSFRKHPQSDTARKGWPKLGRQMTAWHFAHIWAVQILVSDTNGDHFRDFWLKFFEKALHAVSLWRDHKPKIGTHGKRLIDAVYFWGLRRKR